MLTFPLCSGDQGLANISDGKYSRGLHIIPVFLRERIDTMGVMDKVLKSKGILTSIRQTSVIDGH